MQDCPRHKMGLVIGKKGRSILEVMESSGCHVVVHEEIQKVVITAASAEQLAAGSGMVQRLLGSGAPHTHTRAPQPQLQARQFLCPVRKAGLVIGKQGATVLGLMQQSGSVIKTSREDVTPDGSCQIFRITADTAERAEAAVTLLQQLVGNKQVHRSVAYK